MKKPIDIPAHIEQSGWPALLLVIFAIAASIGIAASGPVGTAFILVSSLMIIALVARKSNDTEIKGRGARVSADGVSATFEGNVLWTVPWTKFGGYRTVVASEWNRIRRPERCGVEIIDKQGVVAGLLNVEPDRFDLNSNRIYPGSTQRLFWRALDRNVPEGGPRETKVVKDYSSSPGLVALQGVAGFACLGLGILVERAFEHTRLLAINDATIFVNPLLPLASIPLLLLGMFLILTAFKGWAFLKSPKAYRWITRRRSRRPIDTPAPIEGLRYEDFLIENGGLPEAPELEDGVRYVQVDPEYRIALGHENREGLNVMFGLIGIYGFLSTLAFLINPAKNGAALALLAACILGIAMLSLASRAANKRMLCLRDTVVPLDKGLIVIRPDGSHLSFTSYARRKIIAPSQQNVKVKLEEWREGKKRYTVDRTHLIKASVQLDHEELKQLEQDLQA